MNKGASETGVVSVRHSQAMTWVVGRFELNGAWLTVHAADSIERGGTLQYALGVICTLNRLKVGKQAVQQKLQRLLASPLGG